MKIHYFGTSLTDAGHYFWTLDDTRLLSKGLSFPAEPDPIHIGRYKEWPFNPEDMPRKQGRQEYSRGTVKYYKEKGYTIVAIEGSCRDSRSGSKSVFFTLEELTFSDLVDKILEVPIAKQIIEKMPFQVEWGLAENI